MELYYAAKGKRMAQNKKKILFPSSDVITIFNRDRVVLEGVEGIVFCNSEKMIIKKRGFVTVEGKFLHLEELGNDNVAVSGKVFALYFGEGKK